MDFFQHTYNRDTYLGFLDKKFNFKKFIQTIKKDNSEVESFEQLGTVTTKDSKTLPVFEIHIKPNSRLSRNRVQLRNLVAKQIQTEDGALAVYVDGPNKQWRFSFIAIEYRLTGKGIKKEQTASKRFTYLLGENTKTRTANKRFEKINESSTLEDLKEAFAVEPLNKEFYDKLYKWYEKAQGQVTFPDDEQAENHIQTSLIRLLTRLLFIWFIKEKKLVNADLFDKDKLPTLIDCDQPSSFYKAILQNLFFATLNRPVTERSFRTTTNGTANKTNYLVTNIYRYQNYFTNASEDNIIALFEKTPFLNGGLFECLDREASDEEKQNYDNDHSIRPVGSAIRIDGFSDRADNQLKFPHGLFFNNEDSGLIDLFNQYQFTVEESTPLDVEVALDPELLGKVFENLLASYNPETGQQARKATGSFYTPREIVSYMVDESLKQYFKQHTDLDENQINDLFIEKESTLDNQQIKTIIHAIDNLKILDPAVGSGAYPMGVLQRLVLILERIDPENTHFKQQQIDKAGEIPDEASRDSAIAAIEQIFSQQNQHNAYGKKLYLIENAIYGVDIQSIAIQICKLRFFISLTIEQNPNQGKNDNYGIKALPNLETRFIVADSLLPLGEMPKMLKQADWLNNKIEKLQKKLAEVRHRHFSAKTLETKRKYREEDKKLRQEMQDELTAEPNITTEVQESMRKIVNWDLYNQNSTADWFDPEWQFGIKNGFHIVIGNPPYVQLQKDGGRLGNLYQNCGFKTFARAGDIYQLFYERGIKLLTKAQGTLAFITSNSWMRAQYGKKLRGFLSTEHNPLRLIDMGKDAFEAIVDTNILLASTQHGKKFKAVDMDSISEKKFPPAEQYWSEIQPAGDMAWSILPPVEKKIKSKIEQLGTALKEWDISINYGIKTGLNKAFIIDTSKRDELIAQDPKSTDIIKPILRGRDIQRYGYKWAGLYLIYSHMNIGEHQYPYIRNHLLSYRDELLARRGGANPTTGIVPYKWWQLQVDYFNSGAYKNFEKEKLIWMHMSGESRFSYSNGELYCNNKCFIITGVNLKYLGALLNSKLVSWFMRIVGVPTGMGLIQWDKFTVETIPCVQCPQPDQQPFIDCVDQILTAKQQGKDTTALEAKIDKMVYQLYNLTNDEIKIIEDAP